MTLELKMLALSIVLGLVQIVLASHAASLQRGYVWTASSRDEAVPELTGVAGRLARALHNFVETFPLFAAAHGACCCHTRLDDRVGCSALFLGSCRLCRPVRSWDFFVAFPCMERGDAWDRLDPSVPFLKPCAAAAWPLAARATARSADDRAPRQRDYDQEETFTWDRRGAARTFSESGKR